MHIHTQADTKTNTRTEAFDFAKTLAVVEGEAVENDCNDDRKGGGRRRDHNHHAKRSEGVETDRNAIVGGTRSKVLAAVS